MDMKIKRQAASLPNLPPEIQLQIAKLLPDLRSIHHLVITVPSMYRIWKSYNSELVFAATSDVATTTPQIRDLIWLVALLRSDELPSWTLDDFLVDFVRPTMMWHSRPVMPCVLPQPKSCPLSVLMTATRIHNFTHSCLEFYLNRLRAVQPRLQRPIDDTFDYNTFGPDGKIVLGWLRHPHSEYYETPQMERPSWIEQQVVLRAFWRLQVYHEFSRARLSSWSSNDREKIAGLKLEEMWPYEPSYMQMYHEIASVQEYLQHLGEPPQMSVTGETSKSSPELIDIPATAWYTIQSTGCISHYHYAPNGLQSRGLISVVVHGLVYQWHSPTLGVDFAKFRRSGMAIWDTPRLVALHLMDLPHDERPAGVPCKNPSQYWFSWRSLLSEEEIVEETRRLVDTH